MTGVKEFDKRIYCNIALVVYMENFIKIVNHLYYQEE